MARVQTFEDLVVWQKAMDMVACVYQACRIGPLATDWGLRNQLQRAAVSVPANIAEGYEREHRKEYLYFLGISKGSAGETRCLVKLAARLGMLDPLVEEKIVEMLCEVSRMLKGLIISLKPE